MFPARLLLLTILGLHVWGVGGSGGGGGANALEAVVQALSQKVAQLEARINSEIRELKKLQPSVIFSVQYSLPYAAIVTPAAIPFDDILINQGGGYSVSHNEFAAPVSGLYFLSFRAWSYYSAGKGFVHLKVNGDDISELPTGDGFFSSAFSQSLVQHLDQGDVVSVFGSTSGTLQMFGGNHTTFMGYLIMAD